MGRKRVGVLASIAGVVALATGVLGCGSKSSSQQDAVSMALQTPGVRTIVVSKQRNDLKVVIPPCSEAQTVQPGATQPPPGSNQLVVPSGALTQTVAVQPCAAQSGSSGGSSGSSSSGSSTPPPSSTILVTPGGQQGSSSSGGQSGGQSQSSPQNQLVLPNNSGVATLIVPPCSQSSGGGGSSGGGSSSGGSGGSTSSGASTNLAVPARGKAKSVTAPPCSVPQQSSS
jgi:hypothetical protein